MIKFEGELNSEAKKFLLKKSLLYNLLTLILPIAFIILLSFFLNSIVSNIIYYSIGLILVLILITFLYEISNEGKRERNVKTVCITEEHLEMYKDSTKKGTESYQERFIDDVACVYDKGSFYWISFSLAKSLYFVCQKDLIKEGTIEEFEELFKDKIVKT